MRNLSWVFKEKGQLSRRGTANTKASICEICCLRPRNNYITESEGQHDGKEVEE